VPVRLTSPAAEMVTPEKFGSPFARIHAVNADASWLRALVLVPAEVAVALVGVDLGVLLVHAVSPISARPAKHSGTGPVRIARGIGPPSRGRALHFLMQSS
jgi:hypothetical protein